MVLVYHLQQEFQQIRGGEFYYNIKGNSIILIRINIVISKATFNEALKEVPLDNTVPIQNLQVPSYMYAILMDNRIKRNGW